MKMMRLAPAAAGLVALICLAAGCSAPSALSPVGSSKAAASTAKASASASRGAASTSRAPQITAPAARTWSVVALGDSVPRGTNCDCAAYPVLTADDLTASTGQMVTSTNDSGDGYTSADVLAQLDSDADVMAHVRTADVVTIEIGANDAPYTESCDTTPDCYSAAIPALEKNLGAIVQRVHDLTPGRNVLVVLLDYWSVWLGGQYAVADGASYVDAAAQVTNQVNSVIKATAAATGSAYVDLRAAFKGPAYADDETHYLANDGDHPNSTGHQQIAAATETVIEAVLHL